MATFGIENVLKRELPQFGVPAATVASLAGISGSQLSAYLNGISRVPNDHEQKLHHAWAQLKRLIAYASPLELNFRKVDSLRRCIDKMNDGTLRIVVFQSDHDEAESVSQ